MKKNKDLISLVFSAIGAVPSSVSQCCTPGEGKPTKPFMLAENLQPVPEPCFGVRMRATLSVAPKGNLGVLLYRYIGSSWTPMWCPTIDFAPGQMEGEVRLDGEQFGTVDQLQVWFGYPDQARDPITGGYGPSPNSGPIDVRVVVELDPTPMK